MSDLLAIYLTDHDAGAAAGSTRMRRLADNESDAADGAMLAATAIAIEQDRQTLGEILSAAQVTPRRHKVVAARLAERAGRLKTNGRLVRRSPLTSVVELEFLCMAVTGKVALWTALRETDLAAAFDFDDLIERAEHQRRDLQAAHCARASVVGRRTARG